MTDEYTPSTEQVRDYYMQGAPIDTWLTPRIDVRHEFDRWLAARDAEVAELRDALMHESETTQNALDRSESLRQQLAERDIVIARVRAYAEDRAFHARGHLNTVNSGRIASDLQAILSAAPSAVLAEHDEKGGE